MSVTDIDVNTLESIFHMIQPADLLGAQKLALSNKGAQESTVKALLDVLFNMGKYQGGVFRLEDLQAKLNEIATNASGEDLKQFKRIIHFYSSTGKVSSLSQSQNMAQGQNGVEPIPDVTFQQIIGTGTDLGTDKKMGIITCNSGFLSPAVRNAERVELFMNFLPSIIASRMVPLLEVEFDFNRGVPGHKETHPRAWAPSLIKFLMGGDADLVKSDESPTAKMMALRESESADKKQIRTTAGMELFTAPQTLVNPVPDTGRYVSVLDPFRPLMSIENFSVNVSPTVGLFSYKKATLTLKLHDRSRLAEIADLVRPQVYQDALQAPTVWITYGWRHPDEPDNPYADFINSHMLVREAYGIINSQFAFDQVGQVTITLNLWTKGVVDMRVANINQDGSIKVIEDLSALAKKINANLAARNISLEGTNKEIRSSLVLEAAERGAYPDMTSDEIKKSIAALKASLKGPDSKLDAAALTTLRAQLDELDKKYLEFKKEVSSKTSEITAKQFEETLSGPDPFLPFGEKETKQSAETGAKPQDLTKAIDNYNKAAGTADVKAYTLPTDPAKPVTFRKKLVSLGKLVSVFTANVFKNTDNIDEMQLFFYQLNELAGSAASLNLASFPIEMNVFLDQYREHIERKGSERVTLEEFLQLVFDAQVNDPRALAYGFRNFYAPYDPANKHDVKLAKGVTREDLLSAQANFQMPAPAVYVETTFAAPAGEDRIIDQLKRFELQKLVEGGKNMGNERHYVRIMRVHIFDKANNPYKLPAQLLKGDDDKSFELAIDQAKKSEHVSDSNPDLTKQVNDVWKAIIPQLLPDGKLDHNAGQKIPNDEIKKYVSKMVPTIVYGGNASTVIAANLASKQDPLLATTQMQAMSRKAGRPSVMSPNGTDVGGLPLRIVPASMTLTTLGCPLLEYAQIFFIDFNSGTTIDNLYNLTGITHNISPGKFESQLTLTFADAYGKFFGTHQRIINHFKELADKATQ